MVLCTNKMDQLRLRCHRDRMALKVLTTPLNSSSGHSKPRNAGFTGVSMGGLCNSVLNYGGKAKEFPTDVLDGEESQRCRSIIVAKHHVHGLYGVVMTLIFTW